MQGLPEGFQVDPALSRQMGTTVAVNPQTGKRIRWSGGGTGGPMLPEGAKPRSDYGRGAYETADGTVLAPTKSGGVQVLRGARVSAPPELRARLSLALGPMIDAQKQMYESEGWNRPGTTGAARNGRNPFNADWGARLMEAIPFDGGAAARAVGGEDYQKYEQALRSFESSLLPIFSGAAVTESEAKRFIRANLPQINDTPAILARKATNRAKMVNAAAEMMGEAAPFPKVGKWSAPSASGPRPSITANAPRQSADPFPGIREGQVVQQGGVRYRRQGNQMIPVK